MTQEIRQTEGMRLPLKGAKKVPAARPRVAFGSVVERVPAWITAHGLSVNRYKDHDVPMNIQEKFAGLATLGAGWIMWLLVLLSVLSLAVIIERAIVFVTSREDLDALRDELQKLYDGRNFDGARKRLGAAKSFEAQIIAAGLDDFDKGPDALEERLAGESRLAKSRMERNLAFLGTVGNNAPFIGLLGTVIGVVRAFRQLTMSAGGQVSDALLGEIGEALVATAIGLLVALPAVAFFNYFQRLIKGRLDFASVMGSDLLVQAKSTAPAVAGSGKGA